MALATFDTHKFIQRLQKTGMALPLAKILAEVFAEAFNVNVESLTTKVFLDTRLAALKPELQARNPPDLIAILSRRQKI